MKNMRRILKTPANCLRMADGGEISDAGLEAGRRTLQPWQSMPVPQLPGSEPIRLADGGEVSAWSLKGIAKKLTAPSAPPMSMTEKFARQDAARGAPAAPAQAAAPAPAPTQGISGYVGNGALEGRMKAAGLRDGGTVPGKGQGDKIPALYEPGEFVVSNDMLDAAPGLRDELHTLRGHVLHAKGKTVAEANAQAYSGADDNQTLSESNAGPGRGGNHNLATGHGGRLRALDGFEVHERPWTAADSRAFAPQPGPGNPNVGAAGSAEAQAFRAPPTAASAAPTGVSLEPTAGGVIRDKLFGSSADWAKTGDAFTKERAIPGMKALGKVAKVAAAPVSAYETYQDLNKGNYGDAAVHGVDTAAGAALFTPAAPAAAMYLGGRAAYEAPGMIRNALGESGMDKLGGAINQLGRNTGLWGVNDDAKVQMDAQARGPTPVPKPAPSLRSDASASAGPTNYSGFSGDATMPAQEQIPGRVRVDRQANGNLAFSGTDVSGPVSYQGPGSSGLRDPGKTYNVVPGMSKAQTDAILTNPDGSRWTAQDEATARANLRDGIDQYRGTSRDARNDKNAQLKELALAPKGTPGRKAALALLTQQMQNDTTMYGHNVTERDNIRTNNTSRTNNELTNDTARTRLRYDMSVSDRDYKRNVGKDNFEQDRATQEDWHKHALEASATTGPDNKPMQDPAAAADYTRFAQQHLFDLAQDPKTPADVRAKIKDKGFAALDTADRTAIANAYRTKRIMDADHSAINPLGSSGNSSYHPRDYMPTGDASTPLQKRVKNNLGSVPVNALEYGPNRNKLFWNSGPADQTLVPSNLRN